MALKVAAVNDLSGLGRCSLAADLTVLGAMGIQACAVPTAVLTAQTEYPEYYSTDLTEMLPRYAENWSHMNLSVDGILTGFLNNAAQAKAVNDFIDRFKTEKTVLLVDPIMAEDGNVYDNYTPELQEEMRHLVERADIITPNISELCLLSGQPVSELAGMSGKELMQAVLDWAESLAGGDRKTVIVTGVPDRAVMSEVDVPTVAESLPKGPVIGNLVMSQEFRRMYLFPYEEGSYSGTGDLFAAMAIGGYLRDIGWDRVIPGAGKLIADGVHDAKLEGTDPNDGIPYEKYLGRLTALVNPEK